MYLGENNVNLSETKKCFLCQHVSQPFLKMRKFLLDMRKDFIIINNLYLVEILSEPNSLIIVTSKKIHKMSNYVLILIIFFLIARIRNLQSRIWKKYQTIRITPATLGNGSFILLYSKVPKGSACSETH